MKTKIEKLSTCKVKVEFVVESKVFDEAIDQAFLKKVETIEVKGFRKGKVPRDIYNVKFGEESLYEDAINIVVNNAYQEAIIEHKLDVVSNPELDIDFTSVGKGKVLNFSIEVEVWPDVELGQYKEIEVTKDKVRVTKKAIEEYIERQRNNHAELVVMEDEEIQNGHTVIFDFEGFADGVAFEGGKAENYSLEIGSGQFIPGFEEQMLGLKTKDEKTLKVKFPKDYHEESLKGKEADFKVVIHEIKKRVLPDVNDDFVKELEIADVNTVAEYEEYIKKTLRAEGLEAAENKFNDELLTQAVNNAKFEVPQGLVEDEIERQVKQMEQQAKSYNIPLELLLQYYGIQSLDQYKEAIKPSAEASVRQRAVFLKIAEVENIEITEAEYEKEFSDVAKEYNKTVDEMKKIYAKEMIAPYMKMRKAIDLIKETAISK